VTFAVLWGVPWLEQAHGLPRTAAAFAASLTFAGWAIAAPALGWLTERLGARRPLMLAGAFASFALWSALLWLPATAPYVALCALIFAMGLASGAMPLSFVVAREANPPHAGAFATAVVNFSSIMAIALLQPLVGWLLDLQWTGASAAGVRQFPAEAYRTAFLLFPASGLITLLGMLALRETHPARRRAPAA
jgi:MFS family permease